MPRLALGLIETVGLAAAIEAADTALKSANVSLLGYELSKGGGMVTIKLEGDVGAVKAAVEAGCAAAEKVTSVWSRQIIPRPHDEITKIILTNETVGYSQPQLKEEVKEEKTVKETKKKDNNPKVKEQTTVAVEQLEENKVDVEEEAIEETMEDIVDEKEETKVQEEVVEVEELESTTEISTETCNLCKDPKCPREKGELRTLCIHYEELKEE
ncbi:BMC domain-containing protein [Alkalicella caledoniensis]|uniref:BMC domain-containing protein n=1 Tax=Alkalicella caledoniensis TaxID=2731377 RepID=A0A7G9W5P3_ALKCA|nr:BMC domain-containing protein [Alkalicella caledoniensis]QNO14005.1 BMC domain-containing protein [Alkalicella caledoniensis]